MNEMLNWLREKENREFIEAILDMYAQYDELQAHMNEVRDISKTLNRKVGEYQQEIMKLKHDKQALTAFIMDHVTDEKTLNKIFN